MARWQVRLRQHSHADMPDLSHTSPVVTHEPRRCAVDYDDGDQEEKVLPKNARPSKSPAPTPAGAPAQTPAQQTGCGDRGSSSAAAKPGSAKKAMDLAAAGAATPRVTLQPGRRGAGSATKRKAPAAPSTGDGQAHERLQQLLQEQEEGVPPSRSAMHSISIEVRSLRAEEARMQARPAVRSALCPDAAFRSPGSRSSCQRSSCMRYSSRCSRS